MRRQRKGNGSGARIHRIPAGRKWDVTGQAEAHDEAHDEAHEPMTEIELKLLAACAQNPKSSPALQQTLGYKSRTGEISKRLFPGSFHKPLSK